MTGTPSRPFNAQKRFDPGALGNVVQIKCEWAQRLAYRMSRRALGTLDSRLRVARATYRTTPWNASRPDAETATTSALRAALAATFRASDPEHVEVPHPFFKRFARRAGQSLQEPPSARTCGDVFLNQHRFEGGMLSGSCPASSSVY